MIFSKLDVRSDPTYEGIHAVSSSQVLEVDVTASAVVAAVQAYSKINAAGQWIERSEKVSLNDLFDRMSTDELEEYAQRGTLPKWFEAVAQTATGVDSQE